MTWAEVSPFLGLLVLAAWGLWLRHRTMAKAMEHGYTQIHSGVPHEAAAVDHATASKSQAVGKLSHLP